MLSEIE